MDFPKYPKILNVFEREPDGERKIIRGQYTSEIFNELKDIDWVGYEKIDGTNIRLCWDGDRVDIRGKKDDSQIPKFLLDALMKYKTPEYEEIFEKVFGSSPVVVYGEGYGNRIQGCGKFYLPDSNDFLGFDVFFCNSGRFADHESMESILHDLGIDPVPLITVGKLSKLIKTVENGITTVVSDSGMLAEGLVARSWYELTANAGRVICKIKTRDFR